MTTCLILAAGNAERHNGGNKPLLEVHGETLLKRTARLCDSHFRTIPIVVSKNIDLLNAEPRLPFQLPIAYRWVTETLLHTSHLWKEATVVLLGDVFYTTGAFNRIRSSARQVSAFGKGCNVHALVWFEEDNEKMGFSLNKFVKETEARPTMHGAGKLWLWLQRNPDFTVIDFGDETTDFDSPQEHKRFIEKYASTR